MLRWFFASVMTTLLLTISAAPTAEAAIRNPHMQAAKEQDPVPAEGKAMVVFVRPSGYGNVVAASLFLAPESALIPLGVMYHNEKYAVQLDPGFHRFMVNGSFVRFLDAELEAGKTYHVLVRSEVGRWKAKFSLIPIRTAEGGTNSIHSAKFKEWMTRAEWIEKSPAADAWFEQYRAEIEPRKIEGLALWLDPEWDEEPRRKLGPEHAVSKMP